MVKRNAPVVKGGRRRRSRRIAAEAASEKREAMEKKLRAKLEEEVRELREEGGSAAHARLTSATAQDQQDFDTLLRKLSHAEEKVR